MSAVTLAEARAYLGVDAGTPDARVQAFLDAAEADIARDVGPLEPTIVTVTALNSRGSIPLPIRPYVGPVTYAKHINLGLVYPDPSALICTAGGVLSLPMGGGLLPGTWQVTYTAGRVVLSPNLRQAVLELVRHYWATQRSATFRPDQTPPGAAHARPWRVDEMVSREMVNGGFS